MGEFKVVSPFEPQGDQPEAIAALSEGVKRGDRLQVLLGVTEVGIVKVEVWLTFQVSDTLTEISR